LGNEKPGPDLQPSEDGGSGLRRYRKWIWAASALVLFIAAYLLAGYFLVPRLIRSQATAWVQTNLDKPLALGEIKFDPLRFTVDVSNIAIPDAKQPMVAVGHLKIGFSILSLFLLGSLEEVDKLAAGIRRIPWLATVPLMCACRRGGATTASRVR